ncbi:MAG: alpha/beta hydrolase [Solirubrobacterales bacterium]|nr:alpha/beta hydrolase [Solirubrobacterales bacterium]
MGAPDPHRLVAETRAFNSELERALATVPPVYEVPPEETRRARRQGRGIYPAPVFLHDARTLEVPGPAGPVRLRILSPGRDAVGTFLHIHGGGWTLGDNDLQDPRLSRLARDTGLTVVSVGYRLAPEHPYPAGPDDCEAAALWLLRDGDRAQVGGERLAIGGDSAGAHLSVVTLLRLRDRHGITGAFAAAVLQYGCFDLSLTPSQRLWGERNLVLSTPITRWFTDQFLPGRQVEQRRHPDISPLYADLSGMPPAVFTIGTQDPLLDDTLFMEARWRAAGLASELHVWPEAPHGFIMLPMTVADAAMTAEHDYLRRMLGLEQRQASHLHERGWRRGDVASGQ